MCHLLEHNQLTPPPSTGLTPSPPAASWSWSCSWSSALPAYWWQSSTWRERPRCLLPATRIWRSCCCSFLLLRSPLSQWSPGPGSPALLPLAPPPQLGLPPPRWRRRLQLRPPPASWRPSWPRSYPRILSVGGVEEAPRASLQEDWEGKEKVEGRDVSCFQNGQTYGYSLSGYKNIQWTLRTNLCSIAISICLELG